MILDTNHRVANISVKDYTLHEQIAQGANSRVFRATKDQTNTILAVKQYNKYELSENPQKIHLVKAQASIHKSISSDYLIKVHECIETSDNIYVVLDYVSQNSCTSQLSEYAKGGLSEKDAVFIFVQLMYAVRALRLNRQYSRKLSLDNIYVSHDKIAKVVLGEVKLLKKFSFLSDKNAAPELLGSDGPKVNAKTDVWALGCILHQLLTGESPFSCGEIDKFTTNENTEGLKISSSAFNLLRNMLQHNSADRIDFSAICGHSFVAKYLPNLQYAFLQPYELSAVSLWTDIEFNSNRIAENLLNSSNITMQQICNNAFSPINLSGLSLNTKISADDALTAPCSPIVLKETLAVRSTKKIGKLRLRAKIICVCVKAAKAQRQRSGEDTIDCKRCCSDKIEASEFFNNFRISQLTEVTQGDVAGGKAAHADHTSG